MNKIFVILGITFAAILNTSCAVVMASKQPTKKNIEMLAVGISRSLVVAELGAPITSEYKNGQRHEIYTFTQGYSKAAKVGRAFFHGAADVATMGLWELIGTPTETVMNGQKTSYEMIFDENDRLLTAQLLTLDGNTESKAKQEKALSNDK